MSHGWISFTIILVSIFSAQPVRAGEIYPFFRGVRQMAMGGAGVATVNDQTALLINPAGLGKLRGSIITLADAEIESSSDSYAIYMSDTAKGKSFQDPQQLLAIMNDPANRSKHFHMRAQTFPSIVTTNFGFGVFGKYNLDAEMERNVATPTYLRMNYTNDWGAVLGYCLRFFDGRIKVGVSGKVVNRVQVAQDIPTTATGISFESLVNEGGGIGVDTGIVLTAPWYLLPTLAIAVNDLGDTKFTLGNGYFFKTGRKPEPQKQITSASVAIFPIHGKKMRSSITAEYRDIQNIERYDTFRRLHVGMELNIADVIFLRGGMNQRYYTAGVELAISNLQLQFSTYGEDIGTADATGVRPLEDRRYIFQAAFRF